MFIRQMTYLVALAREKHFGRAAEACNVTQPTLSSGLKALERELDMRLVIREPRFMGLTPEGERVVEWAGQILADYASLKQDVEVFRGGLRGTLRLGVIPAAMPVVAQLTAPFAAKHPQVTVDMQSMTSIEIQRGLDRFELDAGLTYLENEPLSHVRKTALYSERYVFVTSRSGPWGDAPSIAWADAAGESLCLLNESMQKPARPQQSGAVDRPRALSHRDHELVSGRLLACMQRGLVEHHSAYVRLHLRRLRRAGADRSR